MSILSWFYIVYVIGSCLFLLWLKRRNNHWKNQYIITYTKYKQVVQCQKSESKRADKNQTNLEKIIRLVKYIERETMGCGCSKKTENVKDAKEVVPVLDSEPKVTQNVDNKVQTAPGLPKLQNPKPIKEKFGNKSAMIKE